MKIGLRGTVYIWSNCPTRKCGFRVMSLDSLKRLYCYYVHARGLSSDAGSDRIMEGVNLLVMWRIWVSNVRLHMQYFRFLQQVAHPGYFETFFSLSLLPQGTS